MRTLCAAAAAFLLCVPATAGAAAYPADFEEQEMVTGLTRPTTVAWAPDGRTFVVEKDGALKVVEPGGSTARLVKNYADIVNSHHDRGLLGLAVDAQFAQHPYLYLLYTYDLKPMATNDSSAPMVSQLMRVRINAQSQVLEERVILGTYTSGPCPTASNTLDCIPADGLSHSIGTVRSAPDGTLWVGNGDAASFSTVDPLALRTYDESSLAGKLMHVDRNGMGLPQHPFCSTNGNLAHVCTKLHAKGFRNPFRFALQPGGGITLGDVGWNQREEIDLIGPGGRSYGWPCYEGIVQTNGYKDRAECQAEYAKPAGTHTPPDHDYAHGGSLSVMGGPTYTDDEYPAGYRNSIFFADYSGAFIRRLVPGGGGYTVQPFATAWYGTALETAPDGNLAYVSFGTGGTGTGSVRKIVYAPGNQAPVANLDATPTSGPAPLAVAFDARDSSDDDGDALSYLWSFGDGTPSSSAAAPIHTYDTPGRYTARLTVSDGRGKSASATQVIDVANDPPELEVSGDTTYRGGEPFSLEAEADDPQDGALPASAIEWDVRVIHADHTHFALARTGVDSIEVEAITDHDADSYYQAVVTVTDSLGATATRTVAVQPETTTVRVESNLPGVQFSYGGREFTAPQELETAIGFRTTISVPGLFQLGGALYDFTSWSNNGPRVQDFVVPPAGARLKASYAERPQAPAGAPDRQPQAPTTPTTPSPQPDTSGPTLRLLGVDAARGRVRGVVKDPSGVATVQVALRARLRAGKCSWWLGRRRTMSVAPRRCDRPRWMNARLGSSSGDIRWMRALGKRLAPGTYRVLVRARDRAGNVSELPSSRATLARVRRPRG